MRERVSSFKGELNVWSQTSAGTEVELKIPGHIAYAGGASPVVAPAQIAR